MIEFFVGVIVGSTIGILVTSLMVMSKRIDEGQDD